MVYRFTDVVIDSRTGLNPRKNFVLGSGDNYYITIKDIYNGKVNLTDKTDKVDDEAIQIIKRRSRIKVGDVLFVSIGRIGETAIVMNKDDSWDVNESVFVFTLNNKIITPEYFCTMFQSQGVKQYLSGNSSGSTFKSIKMNQLERMTFDLPPVTTQKSITTKLTAVRRIIDLRTSQLAELDNLVKARFVEMFGDPVKNSKRLPTVLGETLFRLSNGKALPSNERFPEGIPAYGGNGVSWYTEKILCDFDTIIVGRVGFQSGNVHLAKAPLWVTDNAMYISSLNTEICDMRFLCALMEHIDFTRYQDAGDLKKITQKPFMQMHYPMPSMQAQMQYIDFSKQTDKSKVVIQKALDEAQVLFDSLMQKYFS